MLADQRGRSIGLKRIKESQSRTVTFSKNRASLYKPQSFHENCALPCSERQFVISANISARVICRKQIFRSNVSNSTFLLKRLAVPLAQALSASEVERVDKELFIQLD